MVAVGAVTKELKALMVSLDLIIGDFCIFDVQGKIRFVNAGMKSRMGYPPDFLLTETVNDWLIDPGRPQSSVDLQELLVSGMSERDLSVRLHDGQEWLAQATVFPIKKADQLLGGLLVLRDATQCRQAESELRDSARQLVDIIESSPDATMVIDKNGKILHWNRAMVEMTGYAAEDMVGKGNYEHGRVFYNGERRPILVDMIVNPELDVSDRYAHFRREGDVLVTEHTTAYVKGKQKTVWGRAAPLYDRMGKVVGAIETVRDITERTEKEEALKISRDQLQDSQRQLEDIIESSPDATLVIDKNGKILHWNRVMVEMTGYAAEDMVGKGNYEHGWVLYNGERRPMLVDMIVDPSLKISHLYTHFRQEGDILITDNNLAYLKGKQKIMWGRAAPLYDRTGKVVGAIETIRDITDRWKQEEALKNSHAQLKVLLNSTVHALAITTEKRDHYTAGHQQRVTEIACAIGKKLNLSAETVENIRIAATLHDIGKLFVPMDVLSNSGELREVEKLFLMTHSEAGFEIIKDIPFSGPVAKIIRQHHERMDGSGYPQGLKGDEILIEARILAVADTLEAMASHRPYRPALGIGKALKEIQKYAGILYDEAVVQACVELIKEHKVKIYSMWKS